MKATIYDGAKFISRDRLNSSYYGNPRARVVFETSGGAIITATTATDSSAGYTVENWRYHGVADVETRTGRVIIDYVRNTRKPVEGEGVRHV